MLVANLEGFIYNTPSIFLMSFDLLLMVSSSSHYLIYCIVCLCDHLALGFEILS